MFSVFPEHPLLLLLDDSREVYGPGEVNRDHGVQGGEGVDHLHAKSILCTLGEWWAFLPVVESANLRSGILLYSKNMSVGFIEHSLVYREGECEYLSICMFPSNWLAVSTWSTMSLAQSQLGHTVYAPVHHDHNEDNKYRKWTDGQNHIKKKNHHLSVVCSFRGLWAPVASQLHHFLSSLV